MKQIMAVMLSMALMGCVIGAQAQQDTTTATTAKSPRKKAVTKKSEPTVSEQLSEMKQAIDAQQGQIKQLTNWFKTAIKRSNNWNSVSIRAKRQPRRRRARPTLRWLKRLSNSRQ